MSYSNPLKLTHDPFGREAPTPILITVQAAFDEVMREIGCDAPNIVIAGPTGSGKTFLLGLIERAYAANGRSVRRIERGDLIDAALSADCDLLLVDEADSTDPVTLQALLSREEGKRPTSIVFACRPCGRQRFMEDGAPVFVALRGLSPDEARHFVIDSAESAGRANLFSGAALDNLIAASGGSPRLLKSIGGHALFFADAAGADRVDPKHVEDAVLAQFGPRSATPEGAKTPDLESDRSIAPETPATQSFDSERGEADVEEIDPQDSLPLDESKLWDPVPNSRRLFAGAFAVWVLLLSAVLYDKNFGGFLYGTSLSQKPVTDSRPIADPLDAMQKVADALMPHRIVLTVISTAPLQQVAFAQATMPANNKNVSARGAITKVSAHAAPRVRAEGRRKLLSSPGPELEFPGAQTALHTPIASPVADEPNTVDRLRNFFLRQFDE